MDWSRQQSERRRDPRFEILAQVRVRRAETDYVLEVKNLSSSGALIELGSLERPGWLKIGRRVELTLFVSDQQESAEIAGDVVRVVEDAKMCAFGVHFVDISAAAQTHLDRLLGPGRTLRPKPPPLPAK
jgi:c-di-GMP-binding flagellar brake protein YcgR